MAEVERARPSGVATMVTENVGLGVIQGRVAGVERARICGAGRVVVESVASAVKERQTAAAEGPT
jgi:hypothetical protein